MDKIPDITNEEKQKIIIASKEAIKMSHSPFTNFPVGAALLTDEGDVIKGTNVESLVNMGFCAERSAIANAVIQGKKDFKAIAVITKNKEPCYPCGPCRQFLYEFAEYTGHDMLVLIQGSEGEIVERPLTELLPNGFGPKDLDMK